MGDSAPDRLFQVAKMDHPQRACDHVNTTLNLPLQSTPPHLDAAAGSDQYVFSPQAFLLVGEVLYAGAGIGINYSDSEFADEPFYALRVGLDIPIFPKIFLDVNVNYRFEEWDFDKIEDDIDLDTLTLGAMLRFQF